MTQFTLNSATLFALSTRSYINRFGMGVRIQRLISYELASGHNEQPRPEQPMHQPSRLTAILLMGTAAACFVVSNALVKHIGQWLPTGEMLFIRGCIAVLILLAVSLAFQRTRQLHTICRAPVRLLVLSRATVEGVGSTLFLASLAWLPLANATAIDLSAPLMLSALAVVFLGERVPAQRWLAIMAGFVGVLMVVQPRADDFNAATLLCILGTGLHAVRDLLTRRIPPDVPSVVVALSSAIAITLLAGAWSLVEGWQPIAWSHLVWLALGAGFLVGGVLCAVASLRRSTLSTVAPFRYLSLPFALLLGYFVWGELPGPLAWAGACLIAASGLWVLLGAEPLPVHDLAKPARSAAPVFSSRTPGS